MRNHDSRRPPLPFARRSISNEGVVTQWLLHFNDYFHLLSWPVVIVVDPKARKARNLVALTDD